MPGQRHDTGASVEGANPGKVRPGPRCSFCSKQQGDVWHLIAGPGVYICSECIELCIHILTETRTAPNVATAFRVIVRRPDGTSHTLEYGPLPKPEENRSWLGQCHRCGTWNVGEGLDACLHCQERLRKNRML